MIFEGAQGTLLDLDHGTYPFVTSSNPIAGAACVGAGVGPADIDEVWGVAKAYATRVGAGPFPTELDDDLGAPHARARPRVRHDHRPRPPLRLARPGRAALRGPPQPAHGAGDHQARRALPASTRCGSRSATARSEGALLDELPLPPVDPARGRRPSTRSCPGFDADIGDCRSEADLPREARDYLDFIAEYAGVPIRLVGVGPGRDQVIWMGEAERHLRAACP